MDLTILIPCKNDKENLRHVVTDIKAKYQNINILVVASSERDVDKNYLNTEKYNFSEFLAPGLICMAIMQNSFANTSSSILISKVQGNIVDILNQS